MVQVQRAGNLPRHPLHRRSHWYLIVEKDTAIIKESLLSQLWKDILVVACIIILILLLVSGTVSRYDKFMTLLATTDKLTGS